MVQMRGLTVKETAMEGVVKEEHDDDHSLNSNSTAPSDSDCVNENKTQDPNEKFPKCDSDEDFDKPPPLADLSYSVEEEEERPLAAAKPENTTDTSNAQDEDDDDELSQDSQESESTLLSDLSSMEEMHDLERLERDCVLRDHLMKKLLAGKSKEEVRLARDFEDSMRKALYEHYDQLATQERIRRSNKRLNKDGKPSYLQRLNQQFLLVETAQGVGSIVLYCVAHLSCWEITTTVLYEFTQKYENETLVHFIFLFVSLVMFHVSGGIFGWLDRKTYGEAQDALQRQYGTPYARLLQWFRHHPSIKALTNLLAFYICWTAVTYFQNRGLQLLDKRDVIAQGLPSFPHEHVSTMVKDKLVSGLEYEEEWLELEALDFTYLQEKVSIASYTQLLGDDFAPLVSTRALITFFATAAVLSISVLHFALGHTFDI